MLEKYEGILQMMEPDEAANWAAYSFWSSFLG
jgi:hypothetical protein